MQFVIFHGAYGNVKGNWFPYVKKQLLNLKQKIILEQFPVDNYDEVIKTGRSYIPRFQNLKSWMQFFDKKILPQLDLTERICFIGHSLSPVFILHILERYSIQLDSAIFVEPFMTKLNTENAWPFDLVNETFYKSDFNFSKLQKLIPVSYVLWSDNDQYVSKDHMITFANKLGSSTIQIKDGQHLNAPLFTIFPLVVELCKTRLNPSFYLT